MRCLDANSLRWKWPAAAAFLLCTGSAFAQLQQQQLPPINTPSPVRPASPTGQPPTQGDDNDNDVLTRRILEQQARKRNELRQKDIVNDTNKLLALTEQLKTEIGNGNKDQARKVEEIEKLAKAVREKMAGD